MKYYVITTDIPHFESPEEQKQMEKMKPLKAMEFAESKKRKHYFVNLLRDPQTGVLYNDWDYDQKYAYRWRTEVAAENFRRVVLGLDGTRVETLSMFSDLSPTTF